jgi:hypothetical protein
VVHLVSHSNDQSRVAEHRRLLFVSGHCLEADIVLALPLPDSPGDLLLAQAYLAAERKLDNGAAVFVKNWVCRLDWMFTRE